MRNYEYQHKMAKRVEARYYKWCMENKFEWTDENVRRIVALNNALMEKENNLYDLFVKVKNDIEKLIADGHSYYENYDIEATLCYEAGDYSTPIADDKTMCDVYCCTNFSACCCLRTSKDRPLDSRDHVLARDLNWNHDMFRNFPDHQQYICRFSSCSCGRRNIHDGRFAIP